MKILDIPRSGSYAGITSSHNTYGQYIRNRSIPTNPRSGFQGVSRARFAAVSEGWRALTDLQRAGWTSLGGSVTRSGSLGTAYTLTGAMAYSMVNRNNIDAGNAAVSTAPALTSPVALVTITPTLTTAVFSLAYTVTPLPAGARAFIYASPQRSAGRKYEGDLRFLLATAAAAASPADIYAAYIARFGTPVVGNRIFFSIQVYLTGFLSAPISGSAVVTA